MSNKEANAALNLAIKSDKEANAALNLAIKSGIIEHIGYGLTPEFKGVYREAMIKIGKRNELEPQSDIEVAVMDYLKKKGLRFSNKQVIHVAEAVIVKGLYVELTDKSQ
jgi:hypothetical protein